MKLPEDLKNFVAHGWWDLWGFWTEPKAGWTATVLLAFCIFADYMGWWTR